MSPQINENILTQIFVETDDLYKAYLSWYSEHGFSSLFAAKRRSGLSPSEVVTIIVAYHLSGYKCFEYYYRHCILKTFLHDFPLAPSYNRFVSYILRALPLLVVVAVSKCRQSIRSGYYFIDSKKLEVCHLRREKDHSVFEGFARKGKGSTGWFFGLKLHLVINHLGQIVSFLITPANVADNNHNVLLYLLKGLSGKCGGDKGYLTTLFEHFYKQGLQLLVRPKKNMKPLAALKSDVVFLKQRPLIESVNDILATVCDVEHTRHRNPLHGLANIYAALIAYQYLPSKPHLFIPTTVNYLQVAA
jgi:hypothetical protein